MNTRECMFINVHFCHIFRFWEYVGTRVVLEMLHVNLQKCCESFGD